MWLWYAACTLFGPSGSDPADVVVIADRIVEIEGGLIRAVHSADADSPVAIAASTRVIRATRVTAGFVDAHGHLDGLGDKLVELDLEGALSYADTLARIAQAPPGPPGAWLLGRGWDQQDWSDPPPEGWPLADDLEKLQPRRRISLARIDGHAIWVSRAALEEAGITAQTPDPADGQIVRDQQGRPTGVLVDGAARLVVLPTPSLEEERRRLQSALVLTASKGLTGVHMMGCSDSILGLLTEIAREGKLPIRVWVYVDADSAAAKRLLEGGPWREEPLGGDKDPRLAVVGIKAYADGALGSRGAWLSAPYTDDPGSTGRAQGSPEALRDLTMRALAARVSVATHAIGDRAVRETLDAYEAARLAHPESASVPLRVEHAQVVDPVDHPRFASLSVIASMQPTHATSDASWAQDRLGPDRIGWAYAWRALSDAGAVLAFGSDFPVEAVDPALGIAAATTRGGWHVEQALTLEQTIEAFTASAARAVAETDLGTLAAGQRADLTLWTDDSEGNWRAVGTIVGGEVITGG